MIGEIAMRAAVTLVIAAVLGAPALAATRVPHDSWGKPGISLDQYRADAAACTAQGYFKDISGTKAAKAFVRGSRELDDATQSNFQPAPGEDPTEAALIYAGHMQAIVHSVNPQGQMADIAALQQQVVDTCLVARGYRRFRLSEAQRHDLAKLAIGSMPRRQYLFRLASDPVVLTQQAEWYVVPPKR
jgi:hypothetical protein